MKAQSRIKHQADKHRSERVLEVGDMIYLKIQPYRHTSLSLHNSLKLHSKFYGPFRILEKVGNTAYKLLLPDHCQLHPVFHVSQLKKHIGPKVVPTKELPLVDDDGDIKVAPLQILERRMIPRNNEGSFFPSLRTRMLPGGHCQATEALIQFVSFVRQVNKSSWKVVGAIQDVSATSPGSFDAHPTAYEKDVGISSSFCLNSV